MKCDLQFLYEVCNLCPNECGVNRVQGERGRCGESSEVRVAWSGLHRGEEPPVTGSNGSGMIFFSGCPLHCEYCQNHQISGPSDERSSAVGIVVSIEELANLMLALQKMGANNLNLVTGTHFIPSIVESLMLAKDRGFTLDVVWNSSGFETKLGLDVIDPSVDLYLVDVKTLDEEVSISFCALALYAQRIKAVMQYLVAAKKSTYVSSDGQLKGIIVRHLVFPGTLEATKEVLRYFAEELKDHCYLSLMVQFEPPKGNITFPPITEDEYELLMDLLERHAIEDGFVQELGENVSWIPDFTLDNPFPEGFASPSPYFLELIREVNR